LSHWQDFYNKIRDPSWPDCDREDQFDLLPEHIRQECQQVFGYVPGQFRKSDPRPQKRFPIQTDTACQLKWNWSTIYLTTEETASCHRTNHHRFDTETFDFHNTPSKLDDRARMLRGEWPERGCEYCQNIELAGGQSDRITNLDFPGMYAPPELEHKADAINVTPRILEVYFDNTCDLKCLYCNSGFSSLWAAENQKHGEFRRGDLLIRSNFQKSANIENNKKKIFSWLEQNGHNLSVLNILGGEPLYQQELDDTLELFAKHPAPHLKLQMFSNLNAREDRLARVVDRVEDLIDRDHLREFEVTASLDCWGDPQEYVRFPLDLRRWEKNFEYLLSKPWIRLIINSTVTPLTVKTLPDLLERIQKWNQTRQIYHYQNSVNAPSYMFIDIFGAIFLPDFERALALKPEDTPEAISSKKYLEGIAMQSGSRGPNLPELQKLRSFLDEMDRRRNNSWRRVFPWLEREFIKHGITS